MRHKNNGSWDAHTYDQVSYLVQHRWGQQVLDWRNWQGNEIVMDAGCGSGLLTKDLAKRVLRGKVYAIDIDSNMIKQARTNLQFFDNVEIVQSSFTDIKLPRKLDVIFSNSAFHWVQDHRKVFQNFWGMLKPMKSSKYGNTIISNNRNLPSNSNSTSLSSGQLLIQCGGFGNLQQTIMLLERITHLDQFKTYFADWKQPWYFAKPDDTDKLLEETGYVNRTVYSNNDCVIFPNRHIYSKFVKTVVMKSYLERLPIDGDDKLKTQFYELFLDEIEKCSNKLNVRWFLDFVRLNIVAYRP